MRERRIDRGSNAKLALGFLLATCIVLTGAHFAGIIPAQSKAMGLIFSLTVVAMTFCLWRHSQRRELELQRVIVAHRRTLDDLEASEQRFRFITESTGDIIWTLDLSSNKLTYVGPAIFLLRGVKPEHYVGKPLDAFLPREGCENLRATITDVVAEFESGNPRAVRIIEIEQPHKDGRANHTEVIVTVRADEFGQPSHILGVTRDITERRRSESVIRSLAYYDGLTELPNRRMLSDRLQQALARAIRDSSRVALLFMDLDRFKSVNDEHGHEIGDWVLKSASQRMLECLRPYDTAARLGGDEFAILLPDLRSSEEALAIAERLRFSLQRAFITPDAKRIQISSSIGVALCPEHAASERDLLRVADEAMYRAKRGGRNNVSMLPPEAPRTFTPLSVPAARPSAVRLNWSPAFSTGNSAIDAEHRNLITLANSLLDRCATPDADMGEVRLAYDCLRAHIEKHFRAEEEQMTAFGYSKTEEHAEVHRHLLRRADDLREQIDRQSVSVGEFVEFIAMDVVAKHMLRYDREYFSMSTYGTHNSGETQPQSREEPSRPGHAVI